MKFPAVIRDEKQTLEFILRGMNNQLTAADNLAPEGTSGYVLTSNGPNVAPSYQPVPGSDTTNFLTGSGTIAQVPLWAGSKSLTDSIISQSGNEISVAGLLAVLSSSSVAGALTVGGTLGVTGATTLTGNLLAAVDGVPAFGARAASRFGNVYAMGVLWEGPTPTTTVIAGSDTCSDTVGLAWSAHLPTSGFTGWEYLGLSDYTMGRSTALSIGNIPVVIQTNSSSASYARCTNNLQDDLFTYQATFYDCGFNVTPQEAGVYILAPNTGTTYQLGEGISVTFDRPSGNVVYNYRNASGSVVDTSVVAAVSHSAGSKYVLRVVVAGPTVSVYYAFTTVPTDPTPLLIGAVTMSAAALAALRDGHHQRVGVFASKNLSGGFPWQINNVLFTPASGAQQQADGFAGYLNQPTTGSFAEGGGWYIGNHSRAGLTVSDGLLIDDQIGSTTAYALRTKTGLVQFGDAVTLLRTLTVNGAATLASTLGVTGAITGSSTIQGTTITATTRFTGPLFGTTTATDVVFDRNSVTQLTLGSLAATFAGTVQGTQLKSTIATGTAPLTVASTTLVSNFTSQYLGAVSQDAAYFLNPTHLTNFGGAGNYLRSTGSAWAVVAGIAAADVNSGALANGMTATTQSPGDNTTKLSTTAFVTAAIAAYAPPVTSVFGRTGAVVAATNDYNFTQLAGSLASGQLSGDYTFPGNVALGTGAQLTIGTPWTGFSLGSSQGFFTFGLGGAVKIVTTAATHVFQVFGMGGPGQQQLARLNGTPSAPTATLNGNILAQYTFQGFDGTSIQSTASLRGIAVEDTTASPVRRATSLQVSTYARLGGGIASRWTFDADGDLLGGDAVAVTGDNTYSLGNANQRVKNISYGGQLISSVAIGTAPFVVTSTTLVANLHANNSDQLGGVVAASYALLASPAFTGTPSLPTGATGVTQTANDNSTKFATTAYVDRASGDGNFTSAAPTGTSSTTAVMMAAGAATITPTRGTKVMAFVSGQMENLIFADGVTVDFRYGTGTAPVNGAAVTGTLIGIAQTHTERVAADGVGFALSGLMSPLVVGTAYWVDISLNTVTGGSAFVTGVSITLIEVA